MPASTAVSIGAIDLKSPLTCGSGLVRTMPVSATRRNSLKNNTPEGACDSIREAFEFSNRNGLKKPIRSKDLRK
jgi:hypothetical protein